MCVTNMNAKIIFIKSDNLVLLFEFRLIIEIDIYTFTFLISQTSTVSSICAHFLCVPVFVCERYRINQLVSVTWCFKHRNGEVGLGTASLVNVSCQVYKWKKLIVYQNVFMVFYFSVPCSVICIWAFNCYHVSLILYNSTIHYA